jgi:hypothetical protein
LNRRPTKVILARNGSILRARCAFKPATFDEVRAAFQSRNNYVKASPKEKSAALLGLACDNKDGHTRLTRGKNFVLCGGSHDTHSVMQETAVKINEHLDHQGKRLEDVSVRELRDICEKVADSIGKT